MGQNREGGMQRAVFTAVIHLLEYRGFFYKVLDIHLNHFFILHSSSMHIAADWKVCAAD